MISEQPPVFGKRHDLQDWSKQLGTGREEAREVLGSLANIGEAINAEIMKLSVAAMNGIPVDREKRDDLLVLSKKYDALVQALHAGDEAGAMALLPKFLSLLQRVTK